MVRGGLDATLLVLALVIAPAARAAGPAPSSKPATSKLVSSAPPASPPTTPALTLAALADQVLPDPDDVALVIDLTDDRLLLDHHPRSARGHRIAPGSVLKAFTAYALLAHGLEQHEHRCDGQHIDVSGVARTCWDRRGHGALRLRTALAASCNVWFYAALEQVEPREVLDAWRRFGLPHAATAAVVADEIPAAPSASELLDVALGDHRALGITPYALLEATTRLARRDTRTGLDATNLQVIAHGLEEAARSGTLAGTFAGLDVAAKSGTGPRLGRGMRGVIIGWAPAARPRFVFVVVKDRGRGARDAGPPARAMLMRLLEDSARP